MIDPKHECNMHRSEDEKPCANGKGGVFSNSRDIRHSNKKIPKATTLPQFITLLKLGRK